MKSVYLGAVTLCVGLALAPQGEAREFADIYTECGLGAMIAPNNAAVAAVTNVTWDLGTTAISSDVTSEETCQGGKEKSASLIYNGYASLEKDLAAGEGEYLTALLEIAGYEPSERDEAGRALRVRFAALAIEPGYGERSRFENAERLYNALQAQLETRALQNG